MFLQQPLRIILGPPTHVLHLVWSARDLAAYQHDKDSSRKQLELSSPPVTLFFHSSKTKGNGILKDYHATSCSLVWFAVNYFTYCMGCQTQLWYGPMREHEALALAVIAKLQLHVSPWSRPKPNSSQGGWVIDSYLHEILLIPLLSL